MMLQNFRDHRGTVEGRKNVGGATALCSKKCVHAQNVNFQKNFKLK